MCSHVSGNKYSILVLCLPCFCDITSVDCSGLHRRGEIAADIEIQWIYIADNDGLVASFLQMSIFAFLLTHF